MDMIDDSSGNFSKETVRAMGADDDVGKGGDVFLNDVWILRYHSPEDDDWRLESYVTIMIVSSVDDLWTAVNSVAPYIKDGMFFLSREYVSPTWDDPAVIDGGSYSIRVPREASTDAFIDMMVAAAGETLLAEDARDRWDTVCCVSISPKNTNNVIKIWMSDADPPDKSKIWMPGCRSDEVFFSLFRESIIRSKKPVRPPTDTEVPAADSLATELRDMSVA